MVIDEHKANLSEKDIEQWLWENPQSVCVIGQEVTRWIKRQYKLPSGIADLIGITAHGNVVVVEVKNTNIEPNALTQVCRYAYDIDYIYSLASGDIVPTEMQTPAILKVVVGRSVATQTMREAEALGVYVLCFKVQLLLSVSPMSWVDEFENVRRHEYDMLSQDKDWADAAMEAVDSWNAYHSIQYGKADA